MRAIAIDEHGGLDRAGLRKMPQPGAGEGEVVVEVHAAAPNHLDIWVRKGRPGVDVAFDTVGLPPGRLISEQHPGRSYRSVRGDLGGGCADQS